MSSDSPSAPSKEAPLSPEALASVVETAKQSRALVVGLGGTSVAVFSFFLFFLHPQLLDNMVNPTLFRLAVGDIVASLFSFVFSATFYYWALASMGRNEPAVLRNILRADWLFALGTIFLIVAPALVLFAINLADLGAFALVLWGVYVVSVIVGTWRFRRG